MEFWKNTLEQIKAGKKLCLLVVFESLGSSPGRQGFKMLVSGDGELQGSIGGGFMEHKLVELSKSLLEKEAFLPFIKRQIHRSDAPKNRSGMICSGEQSIGFYGLSPSDLSWMEKTIAVTDASGKGVLKFAPSGIHFYPNDRIENKASFQFFSEKEWIYQEQPGLKNTVYIIGGGHVGLALSKIMHTLDFLVKICDDRENLNTMERNEFAHEKKTIAYEAVDQWVEEGNNAYIVLMSFGYRKDELILQRLLGKKFKYFGVMGSSEKMKSLLANLEKQGYASADLKKLNTPIGLSIYSKTPEEIAISIAAEIIKTKNTP